MNMTDQAVGGAAISPETAQAEIDTLRAEIDTLRAEIASDPEHAYSNPQHPGHAAVHRRMGDLYGAVYSDGGSESQPAQGTGSGTSATAQQGPDVLTPEAAKAQLDALRDEIGRDPKHPYNDPHAPGHKAVHKRMLDLNAAAFPQSDVDALAAKAFEPIEDAKEFAPILKDVVAPEGETLEAMQRAHDQSAEWMATLKLTPSEGGDLVAEYNELSRRSDLHDDDAIDRRQAMAWESLQALWGNDLHTKLAACQRAAAKLDKDGRFTHFLDETRLGDSVYMIRALAAAAERNGW